MEVLFFTSVAGCRNVEFPDLRVSKTKNGHLVGLILLCCHVVYIYIYIFFLHSFIK